ncbi:MAG: hypothetical protein IJZ70_02980 [Bacteroidales bacterium]|nr:hypothetical protein [Bacteroidales bacterium]
MKHFLLVILILLGTSYVSSAQFYDNDDEIVFYKAMEKDSRYCEGDYIALNFAGDKAMILSYFSDRSGANTFEYSADLLKDTLLYEKRVFNPEFKGETMKYKLNKPKLISFSKDKSTHTEIVYLYENQTQGGFTQYGWSDHIIKTYTYTFIFSKDRNILTFVHDSGAQRTFKRISKDQLILAIKNTLQDKNQSWRDRTSNNNTLYE